MKASDQRLQQLRDSIAQVTPQQAQTLMRGGAVMLDVREADETSQGVADGALTVARGYLELRAEELAPAVEQPVLVMCGSGTRSLFAADALRQMGYRDVRSVAGGFNRWKDEGLPFSMPRMLDSDARVRYARQLNLPEVGEAGQQRLADARVLVVGAGGLGSPAALYLAAAGVGTLGLVDHDRVDRSNLQRQILHADARVGESKVASARQALKALNPTVMVETVEARLSRENVENALSGYDVVVDGSDNFPTRYLVSDACVKLGLPHVYGAVFRFEGQAGVFWPAAPEPGPCYRCLYPQPPPPELAPSCNEAGVLGVLPGIIGLLQATEALKLVLGVGETLNGRLLCVDALRMRFRELRVRRDPACAYCPPGAVFPGYADYEQLCSVGM